MPLLPGNYYDVLGLPPTATPEHVERAYRYHVSLYSDSSLATYSLLDPAERQQSKAQVQEAYDVLKDPLRRRAYDHSQGIQSVMSPPVRNTSEDAASAALPGPGEPAVKLSEPVTGAALRAVREQRGIALEQIAIKSKIGLRYLQYIETDRHTDLPARVYLRGFLLEYARALGLDPHHTADAYLASMGRTR
jgi:flagellar biosynthesis protein FlhG